MLSNVDETSPPLICRKPSRRSPGSPLLMSPIRTVSVLRNCLPMPATFPSSL